MSLPTWHLLGVDDIYREMIAAFRQILCHGVREYFAIQMSLSASVSPLQKAAKRQSSAPGAT
jgi:hypothetical protein